MNYQEGDVALSFKIADDFSIVSHHNESLVHEYLSINTYKNVSFPKFLLIPTFKRYVLTFRVRKLPRKRHSMEGWAAIYIMKRNPKENSGRGCSKQI